MYERACMREQHEERSLAQLVVLRDTYFVRHPLRPGCMPDLLPKPTHRETAWDSAGRSGLSCNKLGNRRTDWHKLELARRSEGVRRSLVQIPVKSTTRVEDGRRRDAARPSSQSCASLAKRGHFWCDDRPSTARDSDLLWGFRRAGERCLTPAGDVPELRFGLVELLADGFSRTVRIERHELLVFVVRSPCA